MYSISVLDGSNVKGSLNLKEVSRSISPTKSRRSPVKRTKQLPIEKKTEAKVRGVSGTVSIISSNPLMPD